jgi:hypothetical protein
VRKAVQEWSGNWKAGLAGPRAKRVAAANSGLGGSHLLTTLEKKKDNPPKPTAISILKAVLGVRIEKIEAFECFKELKKSKWARTSAGARLIRGSHSATDRRPCAPVPPTQHC